MRILSWNVNGIRSIAEKGFLKWLKKESPDILCLQETKALPSQLDRAILEPDGELKVYYGAADTCIGLATTSVQTLIDACKNGVI